LSGALPRGYDILLVANRYVEEGKGQGATLIQG